MLKRDHGSMFNAYQIDNSLIFQRHVTLSYVYLPLLSNNSILHVGLRHEVVNLLYNYKCVTCSYNRCGAIP